jgi:hypothetical protein
MVIRCLIGSLLLLLSASESDAAPAVLDFSRSHTVEDVQRSGLNFKRLSDLGHSVAHVYEEDRDIVVVLPGGRKISQRITIAHLKEKDGVLTHLELHSGVMPQAQAYQVAGMFCDSFKLSHDELEDWYQLNLGKKYDNKDIYLGSDNSYYPAVTLQAAPSFSTNYPWMIRLLIKWNWNGHRGKDEEYTWREFPAPAIPEISLNPPSGLKYDRTDDFKPYIASLEAAFGQSKKAKKTQVQGSGYTGGTSAPPGDVVPKAPADPIDPGDRWWLWIGGAVLLLAVLWYAWTVYRRKD